MKTWPALLLGPLFALADLSAAFAFVTWSCARQAPLTLHFVHAGFLAATLVLTAIAAGEWRRSASGGSRDEAIETHGFIAAVATAVGSYSALVIVAMWIPQWMLSPCIS